MNWAQVLGQLMNRGSTDAAMRRFEVLGLGVGNGPPVAGGPALMKEVSGGEVDVVIVDVLDP